MHVPVLRARPCSANARARTHTHTHTHTQQGRTETAEDAHEQQNGEVLDDQGLDVEEDRRKGANAGVERLRGAKDDGESLVVVEEATLVVCPMSVITSWEAQVLRATFKKCFLRRTCRWREEREGQGGKQVGWKTGRESERDGCFAKAEC